MIDHQERTKCKSPGGMPGGGGGVVRIVTGQIEPRLTNESNLKVVRIDVLQPTPNEIKHIGTAFSLRNKKQKQKQKKGKQQQTKI